MTQEAYEKVSYITVVWGTIRTCDAAIVSTEDVLRWDKVNFLALAQAWALGPVYSCLF